MGPHRKCELITLVCAIGFVAAWSAALAGSFQIPGGQVEVEIGFGSRGERNLNDTSLQAHVGLPVNWKVWGKCTYYITGRRVEWTGFSSSGYAEVASGALPPGLRIGQDDQGAYAIVGVPERAGTWHLQIRFVGATCRDGRWSGDNIQTLHITTEGSSSPRRVQ